MEMTLFREYEQRNLLKIDRNRVSYDVEITEQELNNIYFTHKEFIFNDKVYDYDDYIQLIYQILVTHYKANLSPDLYHDLSKHRSWKLQWALTYNKNTPIEILEYLRDNSEDRDVKRSAIDNLRERCQKE